MWQRSRTNKDNVGASNEFFRHDRTALASFDVIHVLYESPLPLRNFYGAPRHAEAHKVYSHFVTAVGRIVVSEQRAFRT